MIFYKIKMVMIQFFLSCLQVNFRDEEAAYKHPTSIGALNLALHCFRMIQAPKPEIYHTSKDLKNSQTWHVLLPLSAI